MRDRGQQRRAQPLGLGRKPRAIDILRQVDALDRQRRLIGQAHREAGAGRARATAPAGRCRARPRRPARARYGWAGRAASRPARCPSRGRPDGCAASSIAPRPDRPRRAYPPADSRRAPRCCSPSGSSSTTRDLQHRGDLIGGRPQQIVERHRAGELAAEEVELLRGPGARWRAVTAWSRMRAVRLLAMHRDDREEEERDDVFGIGDGEGVERRQEEEIVGEHADEAGKSEGQRPKRDRARSSTAVRKTSAMLRHVQELLQKACPTPSATATMPRLPR